MGARKWVAGLVSVTLLTCQASAVEIAQPIGMVVVANKANLEGAETLPGATVFAPQKLFTHPDGSLSIRLQQAQLTMPGDSTAHIAMQDGQVRTTLDHGAMRMEWIGISPVVLSTLGVVVRPTGNGPAYAELTVTGANEFTLTSRAGELVATYEDTTQIIPAGASFKAMVSTTPQARPPQGAGRRRRMAPIVWFAIGTAAGVSLWLYLKNRKEAVSPTIP